MTKEELNEAIRDYLLNNLSIEISADRDYYTSSKYVTVYIGLDGECIASDSFST